MNVPSNLMYTKTHEWVEIIDEKTVRTGLTAYAAENLGDLVFINLPEVGDSVTNGEALGDVESVFRLMDLLEKLEERERRILEMRFGLRGNRPLTLEEVSQEIGRTRERVRQIQNQALAKLKQLLVDEAGFAAD